MVMHHIYGFDAEGRPFMNMSLKLRLTKNWLEGPWRRIFHIPLDGSPLLHINNSTETEQMFMTPVLWYDEHGWGTYEFFCRPRQAGCSWERDVGCRAPSAGLICNCGAPGAYRVLPGAGDRKGGWVTEYLTRQTVPAAQAMRVCVHACGNACVYVYMCMVHTGVSHGSGSAGHGDDAGGRAGVSYLF